MSKWRVGKTEVFGIEGPPRRVRGVDTEDQGQNKEASQPCFNVIVVDCYTHGLTESECSSYFVCGAMFVFLRPRACPLMAICQRHDFIWPLLLCSRGVMTQCYN